MKLPLLNMDLFQRQVCLFPILLLVLITVLDVPLASAYCWQAGWNPSFTDKPKVQQVNMTTVRVSWNGIVESVECADQFLVKYWPENSPQDWKMTDLIETDTFSHEITVIPKLQYEFQVIAREDKGSFAGIEYNKSEKTKYKTSMYNKKASPTPKAKVKATVEAPYQSSDPDPAKPSSISKAADESSKSLEVTDQKEDQASVPNNKIINLAGLSIELLAIIGVCGIVVILISAGICYKCFCNKKREDIDDMDDDDDEYDEDDEDHFEKERLDV